MSETENFPALVTAVKDGVATVKVDRPSPGCGRCHEPGGCGGGLTTLGGQGQTVELQVFNALNSMPGDRVNIALPRPNLLKAALPAYGGAALLMIAGAAAGSALYGTDLVSIVGALLGLASGSQLFRLSGGRLQTPVMEPACATSNPDQPCHLQEVK